MFGPLSRMMSLNSLKVLLYQKKLLLLGVCTTLESQTTKAPTSWHNQ